MGDKVLISMLHSPITTDICFELAVVGSFLDGPAASEALISGIYDPDLFPLVLKSHTIGLLPVHRPCLPLCISGLRHAGVSGPLQETQSRGE